MRDLPLTARTRLAIGLGLALLLAGTRLQPFAAALHVSEDASWSVFFLAGALLGGSVPLLGLLALAGLVDYAAITFGGVSAFCVSPAYAALAPAYGALYLAGAVYARVHRTHWTTVVPFAGLALVGAAACELIAGGAFYFLSGRFADPTAAEFAARCVRYFGHPLQGMALYLGAAAIAYGAFALVRRRAGVTAR